VGHPVYVILIPWSRLCLVNSYWASQIFCILWNLKFYCSFHKSPPLTQILSQWSLFMSSLLCPDHKSCLFPSDFPTKTLQAFIVSSCISHALPISSFSCSTWWYLAKKLHIMQFSPASKCSAQNAFLAHTLVCVFFPQCESQVKYPYKITSEITVLYILI